MGLGKFISKATKAVGHGVKSASRTVRKAEHTIEHAAAGAAKAVEHAASDAAVAVGKGLASATHAIGTIGVGKFNVKNVTSTLTHAGVGNVNLANASAELGKGIRAVTSIPVLGSIIGVATPIHLLDAANSFANGQRVDRAALSVIKKNVKDYQDVAPYAASIVSFVPAVGPGIGAGIAAGAALSEGKRWDEVAIEAAKGAIPGGNIAKAAFDAAQAAASGKKVDEIALAALPIDDQAKQAMAAALAVTKDLVAGKHVDQALLAHLNQALAAAGVKGQAANLITSGAKLAKDVASGKRVDQALLARVDDAMNLAGPEVAKALQIGTAVGTAKKIQDSIMKQIGSPAAMQALASLGDTALKNNPLLAQGLKLSNDPMFKKGFLAAAGAMSGKKAIEAQLLGIRNALNAEGKKGFDAATAYFIGKRTVARKPLSRRNPPPRPGVANKKAGPAQSFTYFATHGLIGAGDQQKQVLVSTMVKASPEMRDGAADAIRAIANDRANPTRSWWQKVKDFLGIK